MTWWQWTLVVVAGGVGAPLRYVVDILVTDRFGGGFPTGTMLVNLSGSFVLGLITGIALYHGLGRTPRLAAGTGLVGAYTTFSTFSLETLALIESGEARQAGVNLVISVLLGTLAAAAGWALAAV